MRPPKARSTLKDKNNAHRRPPLPRRGRGVLCPRATTGGVNARRAGVRARHVRGPGWRLWCAPVPLLQVCCGALALTAWGGARAARVERRAVVAAGLASLLAVPAAARANEVTDIFAKASPNDVVEFLLDKLKKNDTPAPDAGLKVLIGAASPSNPATADPERFKSAIKGSAYSILLGNYESMRMAKAEEGILQNGNYGATVSVRLDATVRKMAALGVDQKFLFAAEEPGARTSDSAEAGDQDSKLFCIMNFQLQKDPANKSWMVDTVYFVSYEQMQKRG